MSEDYEEEQVSSTQCKVDDGSFKIRPPNKKKYDDDIEKLVNQIREKDADLEKIKVSGGLNITNELKNLKTEKSSAIAKRKQIDIELEKLKKVIPEKMHQLGQLESSLIYKNEEKINGAIQRLEWNLKVQPFKLMEEKKIVSEIDRLKRSKKILVQYLALKQDTAAIRDMQRAMREERDTYFQAVGKLNFDEEQLRRESTAAKSMFSVLKSELDELYNCKRQLVAIYKKQVDEYQGVREKQRKGSWKKREDYRRSAVTERRKQQAEFESEKPPYERYIFWCNSLIRVLSRYSSLASQEPLMDSLSPASSVEEPELAEEIGDGQYILLKKNDEGLEQTLGTKRPSKKNFRPRKQSSIKKVTLSPDMVQQLTELGLKTPNSMAEVAEAIENLRLKKVLLEQEQQSSEVASDAGISSTESLICEMSRQASKTESYEGAVETNPGEHVYAEILQGSHEEHNDNPESWDAEGAVGGCDEILGILSPNSDSTVEGDTGSSESQSSVCKNPERSSHDLSRPVVVVFGTEEEEDARERILTGESRHRHIHGKMQNTDVSAHMQMMVLPEHHQGKSVPSNVSPLVPYRSSMSLKAVESGGHIHRTNELGSGEKPTFLGISPLSLHVKQPVMPSTSPLDYPSLTTTSMSTAVSLPLRGNKSVWDSSTDAIKSAHQTSNFSLTTSPTKPHYTLAARLSNPSTAAGTTGPVQATLAVPQPALILDSNDFPSLSQSMSRPRRESNLSTRSSNGSSSHQERLVQSCDQHPSCPIANQITSYDISGQPHCQIAFPAHQSQHPQTIPVSEHLLDSQLTSQNCSGIHSYSDKLLPVSQIPSMDKSSTEKWVESSVAFAKDFIPHQCQSDVTAAVTESTRL